MPARFRTGGFFILLIPALSPQTALKKYFSARQQSNSSIETAPCQQAADPVRPDTLRCSSEFDNL
jgi:hypothetical protein